MPTEEVTEFSTKSLERELAQALDEDVKHQQTETMKKRAITTAKDYDEFKNMVACAHLKPVTSKELSALGDESSRRGWKNRGPAKQADTLRAGSRRKKNQKATSHIPPSTPPTTSFEFEKNWKRNCPLTEDKKRYLDMMSPKMLSELCRTELDFSIIGDILIVLAQHWCDEVSPDARGASHISVVSAASRALSWLTEMSSTGRFDLNLGFLDQRQTEAGKRLFDEITAVAGGKGDDIEEDTVGDLAFSKDSINATRLLFKL